MINSIATISIIYDSHCYRVISKIIVNGVSYLLCESFTYTKNNPHYIVGFVNEDFDFEIINAENNYHNLNDILKTKGIL